MFILDSLLVSGLRFVLDKVAAVADAEMNDEEVLRERLLEAQMQVELGEMSQEEFAALEADIIDRIRDVKQRQGQDEADAIARGDLKVTGVEATFEGEEH